MLFGQIIPINKKEKCYISRSVY